MYICTDKKFTHGETRTRNLQIRSPTPYPLGHAGYASIAGLTRPGCTEAKIAPKMSFVCWFAKKLRPEYKQQKMENTEK